MKILNGAAITTAYLHFLRYFLLLMSSVLLIIFLGLKTFTRQIQLLSTMKERYDEVLYTQQVMGQKTDSLYRHLSLLNTNLIQSNWHIEKRIIREKDELDSLLARQAFERQPHAVYRKLSGYIGAMLAEKDSVRTVALRVKSLRQELQECQERQRHQQ